MAWNSLWYLRGSAGGGTAYVLLGGATIVEPISAEIVDNTLEAALAGVALEAQILPPLEAEVD